MNMIASATVIRGQGECEAYMNGVVMKEMKRLNAIHAAEMGTVKNHRNRLLAERLEKLAQKEKWWVRLKDRLETAWAVFIALLLELGFIAIVEDETHE